MTDGFSLAVLAGGGGRRLGGCVKPLALLDGQTLVSRIIQALGGAADEVFLVAPQSLQTQLQPHGRVVLDPGEGPGRAVYAAADAADAPWLFVVAGDHVAPSVVLFERLWSLRTAKDAVVVQADDRLQGTYALFRRDAVLAQGAPGPRSLHGLLNAINIEIVPKEALNPDELQALTDVDTFEEATAWGLVLPTSESFAG